MYPKSQRSQRGLHLLDRSQITWLVSPAFHGHFDSLTNGERLTVMTRQPAAANSRHVLCPMPREAPVSSIVRTCPESVCPGITICEPLAAACNNEAAPNW